ncbi:MAG: heme-binding domain-containing protein, partial [Bacteroidetes bacterium]|nr:heme-binding domain-containing protein [Bacteroidota bacterium]
MKKSLSRAAIILVLLFILIQLVRPERTNPPIEPVHRLESVLNVPEEVRSLLRAACYDCHSNETAWPWYSNISPVSWLMARDVTEGRRQLNFSEWGTYESRSQIGRLEQIAKEVSDERMPLPIYLPLHPEAQLTGEERDR